MAEASEGPEMILIRNDTLFDPAPCGVVDLFLGAGRILGVGTDITPPAGVDCLTIDGTGLSATPGFIDGHVHIAGAGGDGGTSAPGCAVAAGTADATLHSAAALRGA